MDEEAKAGGALAAVEVVGDDPTRLNIAQRSVDLGSGRLEDLV